MVSNEDTEYGWNVTQICDAYRLEMQWTQISAEDIDWGCKYQISDAKDLD